MTPVPGDAGQREARRHHDRRKAAEDLQRLTALGVDPRVVAVAVARQQPQHRELPPAVVAVGQQHVDPQGVGPQQPPVLPTALAIAAYFSWTAA